MRRGEGVWFKMHEHGRHADGDTGRDGILVGLAIVGAGVVEGRVGRDACEAVGDPETQAEAFCYDSLEVWCVFHVH